MNKGKKLCFEGEIISCGVDVHKTNWKVIGRMNNLEIETYTQDPDPDQLADHFVRKYPGATLEVAYEAGFCGFGLQRALAKRGVRCLVVNPADIPTSHKDRRRKTDKRDARKLSSQLEDGKLNGIYVPSEEMEHGRALVRLRHRLMEGQTQSANRIKHFLMYHGLKSGAKSERWSLKFIKKLRELDCGSVILKLALEHALNHYQNIRQVIKDLTLDIKKLAQEEPYKTVQKGLQSIDGIGLINGMIIQTEIMDIMRFRHDDSLHDFAGLVPDIYSTNDKTRVLGITKQCNEFLKAAIIESSWVLIKKDPLMLQRFNEYSYRMGKNKAIIRIGKHLLSTIRSIWKSGKLYKRNYLCEE